ncbi:MAG: 4Fe-4S binding protein [Actinomycetota bacterium]|jgi:NADH-quinone oxidoreductase subunit I|nr:4Fe-4S binding protein [Actinomycetota bacterium]
MWGFGLINGLRITMRNMLRGPITVMYPYEKLELPERSRWAVRPVYFDNGDPMCTACMACVRTCPDHILDLEVTTAEDKSKHIDRFSYEVGACMMCGLCVETCPFDAIVMSHEYELAVTDPAKLSEDLVTDVDATSAKRHREIKAAAQAATEAAADPSALVADDAAPTEKGGDDA